MKKRICFLMTHFFSERVGGVEIQTYLLAKYLAQAEWDVHFLAETENPDKAGNDENWDGIHVHWLKRKGQFHFIRYDIEVLLNSLNPDFVYQRGRSRITFSGLGARWKKATRGKLIYHCAEDNDFNFDFHTRQADSKRGLKKIVWTLHGKLADHYFKKTIKASDIVLSQTEFQKNLFKEKLGLESFILRSAHEIPDEPFTKSSPQIVFWIANVGRRKQAELFVKLASSLQDTPAHFVMAGPIPDEIYKKEILGEAASLKNFEYIGPLSWEESNKWFTKASLFINTTLPGREGFPNTYIQAWMRGVPVITLHCDPDGIIKKNGLGFCAETLDNMTRLTRTLLADPAELLKMSEEVMRYASKCHDIKITSANLVGYLAS